MSKREAVDNCRTVGTLQLRLAKGTALVEHAIPHLLANTVGRARSCCAPSGGAAPGEAIGFG